MAMSPAERQKLYRERKKDGCQIVPVELTWNDFEALHDAGLVSDWRRPDPEELTEAIRTLLDMFGERDA